MSIELTEAERLILSSLGYATIPKGYFSKSGAPVKGNKLFVTDILDQMKHQATTGNFMGNNINNSVDAASRQNYIEAIDSLSEKLADGNYVVSGSINNNTPDESGFAAFAIEPENNIDGEVIICCRGSDKMSADNINDWVSADLGLAWDSQTQQQAEMEAFMERYSDYESIYLSGHSLGGNLAIHGAVSFSDPSKIKGVYAFDAPGVNGHYVYKNHENIDALNERIMNYQNEDDMVSSYLHSVGSVIVVGSAMTTNDADIVKSTLTNHNRWAIQVNSDGTFSRKSRKSLAANAINIFSKSLRGFQTIVVLSVVVYSGGWLYRHLKNKISGWFGGDDKSSEKSKAIKADNGFSDMVLDMLSSVTIQASPAAMIAKSDTVEKTATSVRNRLDSLDQTVKNMSTYWDSDTCRVRKVAYRKVSNDIERAVEEMGVYASILRAVAMNYSDTEAKSVSESMSLPSISLL